RIDEGSAQIDSFLMKGGQKSPGDRNKKQIEQGPDGRGGRGESLPEEPEEKKWEPEKKKRDRFRSDPVGRNDACTEKQGNTEAGIAPPVPERAPPPCCG